MKKFHLELDTDSINKENEEHTKSFNMKIKHLADHCIQFIEGAHNEINCADNKFDRNIHDIQEEAEKINIIKDSGIKNKSKNLKQIIRFEICEFSKCSQKHLLM